jgi:hypothetical protein
MKGIGMKMKMVTIAIAAAFVTQSVYGIINDLVIIENSSTSLTVTYNGSTSGITINNFGPDGWAFRLQFPLSVSFAEFITPVWFEPENSTRANFALLADNFNFVEFLSDLPFSPSDNPVPNGTTVENVGTDNMNGGTINMTLFDNAATAEQSVPDTGSTLSLLFLSLTGLLGVSRLCSTVSRGPPNLVISHADS